jgi:hypothetical protein
LQLYADRYGATAPRWRIAMTVGKSGLAACYARSASLSFPTA